MAAATTTAYVSIGNSDNKLTHIEWSQFYWSVDLLLREIPDVVVHGQWHSFPAACYVNACWCIEFPNPDGLSVELITRKLGHLAHEFRQDSIAWVEVPATYFIEPSPPPPAYPSLR